jgi:hypothetical protein
MLLFSIFYVITPAPAALLAAAVDSSITDSVSVADCHLIKQALLVVVLQINYQFLINTQKVDFCI